MKKIWKDNAKLIMAIFITIVIASGATYAATTMYDSNIVGYDNTTSGLRSTNVQDALDELYGNIAEVIINIKNLIGNSTLTTSNQTLSGAINELDGEISSINTCIGGRATLTYAQQDYMNALVAPSEISGVDANHYAVTITPKIVYPGATYFVAKYTGYFVPYCYMPGMPTTQTLDIDWIVVKIN